MDSPQPRQPPEEDRRRNCVLVHWSWTKPPVIVRNTDLIVQQGEERWCIIDPRFDARKYGKIVTQEQAQQLADRTLEQLSHHP